MATFVSTMFVRKGVNLSAIDFAYAKHQHKGEGACTLSVQCGERVNVDKPDAQPRPLFVTVTVPGKYAFQQDAWDAITTGKYANKPLSVKLPKRENAREIVFAIAKPSMLGKDAACMLAHFADGVSLLPDSMQDYYKETVAAIVEHKTGAVAETADNEETADNLSQRGTAVPA